MRLYKRNDVWWAWGYDQHGKRWRKSTKQVDKTAARIVAAGLAKGHAVEASGPKDEATLDQAITAMIEAAKRSGRSPHTVDIMILKGSHLARLLGAGMPCAKIELAHTTDYAYKRLDEGAHKHTVQKEIRALVQALRRAAKLGLYKPTIDPRSLKPDELSGAYVPRERWLPVDEYRELLAELDPARTKHTRSEDRRDYLAVWTQTGMRDSELYGLLPEHADFETRELTVNGTKTKASRRRVPMTPAVEAILRRRIAASPTGPIFPRWGNVNRELAMACLRIEQRYNPGWEPPGWEGEEGAKRRKAGAPPPKGDRVPPPRPFEPVTPNDLRRTYASWLAQAGVALQHASKLMGHESTAMLEKVYSRLAPTTLRGAVDKLPTAVTREPGYGASLATQPCSAWQDACSGTCDRYVPSSIGFVGIQPISSERVDA